MKTEEEGSLTIFSALSLLLILSFLLALLEGARVSGLQMMDTLAADTGMDCAAAEYQTVLWDKYHLLYLDGAYGWDQFDENKVSSRVMDYVAGNLSETGENSVFRTKLCEASLLEYMFATDNDGTGMLRQASAYMKRHLPEDVAKKMYQQYQDGKKAEADGKTEYSVEDADQAIINAKKEKEQADQNDKEGAPQEEAGEKNIQDNENNHAQDAEDGKKESPIQIVLQLKQNALLGMTVSDMSSLSAKAVEAKDMVSNRQCETGRYDMKKAEKMNVSDRVMVLEYIGKHFSDYTEPGKGDLTYEMEYILCGKDTDKKNLESSIERLMRMREAANVAHIIADREKLNQTLMIATSLAGFSGNPAVVKIVQIGVVAAWAYVESILDLRTLLSGGKISLIKSAAEWTTDLKKLGEIVTGEGKARECKNGLSYQAYIKQLLFAMKEKKMAYRMMDIMELAMQKEQNGKNARMDHMIDNMICELRFEAKPLFAKRSLYGDMEMGGYTFFKRQKLSYINK